MPRIRTALALCAIALAVAVAASAGEGEPKKQVRRVFVHHGADKAGLPDPSTLEGDRVKIEDLATLAVGDSRTYTTAAGRDVVVTAQEGGRYTVAVGDHTLQIGGEMEMALPAGEGERVVVRRHHQKDGAEVEHDVLIGAPMAVEEGGEPPVIIEIVDRADGKEEKRFIVLRVKESDAP